MEIIDDNFDFLHQRQSPQMASASERLFAFLIDILIFTLLTVFLKYVGQIAGLSYLLIKDALPFTGGQSVGKYLLRIRVVDAKTGEHITHKYEKSVIRQLPFFIPLFNLLEVLMMLNGKRYGDQWAETVVIKETNRF